MKRTNLLIAAGLLGALAATPAMAQRAHLGLHTGFNFDRADALLGAQFAWPVSSRVDAYPSLDYYLQGEGSAIGFNLDLKLRNVGNVGRQSVFYVGGGLNMMRSTGGGSGDSDMDTGGNLFVGYESRMADVHPYFEIRGLLHEQSAVQIVGGLNFSLY